MANATDTELMERLRRGDEAALGEFIERHRQWLYTSALHLLDHPDAAADAVQETFIRLWLHRRRYNRRYAPTTWLRIICTRICYNELRRRQRHRKALKEMAFDKEADTLSSNELYELLLQVVASLPAKQQQVYRLRELEGLDTDEVCTVTGMKATQVKSNLWAARTTVKEKMKQYGIQ